MVILPEVRPEPEYLLTSRFRSVRPIREAMSEGAPLAPLVGDKLSLSYRKPLRCFLPEPSQGLL